MWKIWISWTQFFTAVVGISREKVNQTQVKLFTQKYISTILETLLCLKSEQAEQYLLN